MNQNYNAKQVADFFLFLAKERGDNTISNLKLQKLVYYAQAFSLAGRNRDLFREPIVAWEHGPVVVELYHEYKKYGYAAIPVAEVQNPPLQAEDQELIELVYEIFARQDALTLRDWTHEEAPWKNAQSRADKILTSGAMRSYFSTASYPGCEEGPEHSFARLSVEYILGIVDLPQFAKCVKLSVQDVLAKLKSFKLSRPLARTGIAPQREEQTLKRLQQLRDSGQARKHLTPERIKREADASAHLAE